MGHKGKSRYHHGDLRTTLIQATIEIINQDGIEAVTMRRLSDWTGVSRTAPYRHFEDKAELLTATAIEGFSQFSQILRAVRQDESADALTRFRNMGHAYIRFALENTPYYRLMFGKDVIQSSPELQYASDSAFNELLAIIEELQQTGLIGCDDPRLQAVYIWALMHGLASLIIDRKLHPDHDLNDILGFVEDKLLKSLLE
jgi:AcrR family transcriptional regulator